MAIHLNKKPVKQYTITSSAEANGSIIPNMAQIVNSGASIIFSASPNFGYGVSQWLLDGNLVQTGGTTYQLANITANHTVQETLEERLQQ